VTGGYARSVALPLKLCVVSMHTSPAHLPGAGDAGGMNVVERAQASALAALGHQVDMVTRRTNREDPDVLELAPGVRLHHLDAGPPTPLPKSVIDDHLAQFGEGLAKLGPFDLYHSHHWMSGVAALPVARTSGVPHVQSFHSVAAPPGSPLSAGEPPESLRRVPGEALVATESDAVVAISAAEAHTVIERCGADPQRVSIIAPGVDHQLFRPLAPGEARWAPSSVQWPRGYVAFAARLQPLKGPDLALRALAAMQKSLRPQLVLAGDASADFAAYTDELHALVEHYGLAEEVSFIGPQSRAELARLFRGARVVLVPSHSETFGLVALEAASSGTPVLAAASGGLREAVAHGETGQLMDSRDPADWARAMTELLADPDRLSTMGVVARVHARRFDWRWTAQQLAALYATLVGR
jgi:D-inositol-3-phosphate glycosyltransferase